MLGRTIEWVDDDGNYEGVVIVELPNPHRYVVLLPDGHTVILSAWQVANR